MILYNLNINYIMVDIITLIIACGAVAVSILGYIRHSECFGVKIDTRTPKTSAPTTPNINNDIRTPLLGAKSEPINIPPRIEPKRVIL